MSYLSSDYPERPKTIVAPVRQLRWNIASREGGSSTVAVHFKDHGLQTADKSHVNYKTIIDYLVSPPADKTVDEQENHLLELFDIVFTVGKKFEVLGADSGLSVSGGRIFYDGDEINSSLTDAILKLVREDGNWEGLVKFFVKMKSNPNPGSITQLYDWLKSGSWSICDDGDFIGYKSVTLNWNSHNASGAAMVDGVWIKGPIPNKVGSVIEMPRSSVRNDPANACAEGLHIGTFNFAKNFGTGHLVSCKINPRNVVSVPNHENTKLRVCKYVVVEEVDTQGNSISHKKPVDAKATYTDDSTFAKYIDFKKADFQKMNTKEIRALNKSWKVGTVRTPKAVMVDRFTQEAKRLRNKAAGK